MFYKTIAALRLAEAAQRPCSQQCDRCPGQNSAACVWSLYTRTEKVAA